MKFKKAIAVIASASLLGMSLCSCTAPFVGANAVVGSVIPGNTEEEILTNVVTSAAHVGISDADKQETVYVKTDSTGKATEVIVSDWLKNSEGTTEVRDYSDLSDIHTVKGKETYSADGNNLTWETKGEDIYYQGTTDRQLPVEVKLTYMLDGKETAPEDLLGKSGHVTIRIDYKNNSKENVKIGDREETIYTPFAVVSSMALDEERFTNVSVSNGTVISDGKRDIVAGMAFPGLVDSLNGSAIKDNELLDEISDKIDIPDSVVIEADVNDYESGMIITMVTSDVTDALGLDSIDLDSNSEINDLKDKVSEFSSAGSELADGSKTLKDGIQSLSDGTGDLLSGTNDLYNGVVAYTDGAGKVASGASSVDDGAGELDKAVADLAGGIDSASEGASALSDGASAACQGAKQVSEGASEISEKTSELSAGAAQVSSGVDSLVQTVGTITGGVGTAASAVSEISGAIDSIVAATGTATDPSSIDTSSITVTGTVSGETASAAMMQYITADSLSAAGLSDEQAQQVIGMISAVSSQVIPGIVDQATDAVAKQVAAQAAADGANEVKTQIYTAFTAKNENDQSLQTGAQALAKELSESYKTLSSDESKASLEALTGGASALAQGASQLSEGTAKLSEGAQSLYAGTASLLAGADQLNGGLAQLSGGAWQLKAGSAALKDGTSKLASGSNELVANSAALVGGSKSLADGSAQLSDGVRKLLDGSIKLNEGMVKFNEEGISRLTEVFDTDIESMKERIHAIAEAGRNYNSFSGVAEGSESNVKFIIESPEIRR